MTNNSLISVENSRNWFARLLKKPFSWILLILIAFGAVYATSLTFVYVEGDDAISILYHVLGRNNALWPPYSAYQSMMDGLLSIIPQNEPLLRVFSISLSALAGLVFWVLALVLAFEWLGVEDSRQKTLFAAFSLLAIPEIFFLGLFLDPSLISISLMVAGHLLVRNITDTDLKLWTTNRWIRMFAAGILFGLGVSFRWSLLPYGLVIVTDMLFFQSIKGKQQKQISRRAFLPPIFWGSFVLLSAFTFILINGKADVIVSTFTGMSAYFSENLAYSLFSLVGLQSAFTPIIIAILPIGLFRLIKDKKTGLLIIVVASFITILPSLMFGVPKTLLTFFPALIALSINGVISISQKKWNSPVSRSAFLTLFFIILISPWFFGIKAQFQNTLWGPGFEIRVPGDSKESEQISNSSKNWIYGRNLSLISVNLAVNDALAIPTMEGPRPFGAYGKVLLGGGWRNFVTARDQEIQDIIDISEQLDKPILSDGRPAILIVKIIANGYSMVEPPGLLGDNNIVIQYKFKNTQGRSIQLLFPVDRADLFNNIF